MPGDLSVVVRTVAEQLLAELRAAEQASDQWREESVAYPLIVRTLESCIGQLDATGCVGDANRIPSSELWNLAQEYLAVGELQLRARMKPRGYAGDFELLKKICDNYRCSHRLGSLFDRFFQAQAAPQAVRNRTQLVADRIVAKVRRSLDIRCKIVSFGCSAAVDVEMALRVLSNEEQSRLEVVLFDLDPAAIEECETRLTPLLPSGQLICRRENLLRLPKLPKLQQQIRGTDFLFCTGLFDYLDRPTAATMLATFWHHLTETGELLVFNFGPDNPSRGYMEWIGNWYLLYRTRDEMLQMGEEAGLPRDGLVVDAEQTGVNLFLAASRTGFPTCP